MTLIAALVGSLIVAAVVWIAAQKILADMARTRDEAARGRTLQIMALFAPAMEEARTDPRSLLVWQPLAKAARGLMPEEFASLDRTFGTTFPFSNEVIQAAHAQWSSDWLAWERAHDAEYKRRAAEVQDEIAASGATPALRAKLDIVESEKLELYQRRYVEYVRTAKALQALTV